MNSELRPGDYVIDLCPSRNKSQGQVTSNLKHPVVTVWWFDIKNALEYNVSQLVKIKK